MLSAYHDDQLPPEKDREIQEHFVDCAECPELMLDLDRFTRPAAVEAAQGDLSDTWVDMAWRRLRVRITVEAPPARSVLRWLRSPLLAWSLTMLLIPCAVGLWLRAGELAEEMRGLEAPQLNPPWCTVAPLSALRGPSPPSELAVPAGARRFLLVFHASSLATDREYRLEIRNGHGEGIWEQRGLRKSVEGTFVVTLSRSFLPAGLYLFRVIGTAEGEESFLEEFPLLLTYQ